MSLRSAPSIARLSVVAGMALGSVLGCSGQSANRALDRAVAQAGISKDAVYPLAGSVTVDWMPPQFERRERLVVMLHDPQTLDRPAGEKAYVVADPKTGAFAFTTYRPKDGVKAGTYILTFAVFRSNAKAGLLGPDKLHNLYNDPDKNSKIAEFKIDHKSPGKTDYSFNLEVAGKEPAEPGLHAVTDLADTR